MKYSLAILGLVAAVSAQSLADIPSCALPCLDKAVASKSSCKTTDIACVCKNFDAIQSASTSCVLEKCGESVAVNKVLPASTALCKNAGSGSSGSGSSKAKAATTAAKAATSAAEAATSAAAAATSKVATEVSATTDSLLPTGGAAATPASSTPTPGSGSGSSSGKGSGKSSGSSTTTTASGASSLSGMGALSMILAGLLAL